MTQFFHCWHAFISLSYHLLITTLCRQHFSCLWCYVKPWLWIQNLCSPCYERLCFIWCPVHYCQHIWKVLSLETSPILFQAGLNISRREAENETFSQETACSAFYLVQQSEGLILCKTHSNKQLYIYLPHLWDFSLFFFSVWLCREIGKKFGGGIEGYCKYSLLVFCDCLDWYRRTHQCTVSNQRPIK